MFIRTLDFLFALIGLVVGLPLLLTVFILGLFDTGSPVFFQKRVGRNMRAFTLVKFRTMTIETADIASHLANASSITKFGSFLRKTKLDEVPQLWNVLLGDMSLVGPRPCLFSQEELIEYRKELGVLGYRPGITGLAQISDIDMSTPELLAKTDAKMLNEMSLRNYFRFIFLTLLGKGRGDRIIR